MHRYLLVLLCLVPTPSVLADQPDKAACEKLGTEFVKRINAGDAKALDATLDVALLIERTTKDVTAPEKFKKGFVSGLQRRGTMARSLCNKLVAQKTKLKFLGLRQTADETRVLVRLLSEEGMNFWEMVVVKVGDEVKVADIYFHISGEMFSAGLRRFYVLGALSETARQGGADEKAKKFLTGLQGLSRMRKLHAAGRFKEALKAHDGLPVSLKGSRSVMVIHTQIALNVSTAALERAVAAFEKAFPGDPALNMLMIDVHVAKNAHAKALTCIDAIEKVVGKDAYFDYQRSELRYAMGEKDKAKALAEKSYAAEPTLVDPLWVLIAISINTKKYEDTVKHLDTLEANHELEVDFAANDFYADFVKSDAYKAWVKRKKER